MARRRLLRRLHALYPHRARTTCAWTLVHLLVVFYLAISTATGAHIAEVRLHAELERWAVLVATTLFSMLAVVSAGERLRVVLFTAFVGSALVLALPSGVVIASLQTGSLSALLFTLCGRALLLVACACVALWTALHALPHAIARTLPQLSVQRWWRLRCVAAEEDVAERGGVGGEEQAALGAAAARATGGAESGAAAAAETAAATETAAAAGSRVEASVRSRQGVYAFRYRLGLPLQLSCGRCWSDQYFWPWRRRPARLRASGSHSMGGDGATDDEESRYERFESVGGWHVGADGHSADRYCTYVGAIHPLTRRPHGMGEWVERGAHGECLRGVWVDGRPVGPFCSREFGSGYASVGLRVGFVADHADPLTHSPLSVTPLPNAQQLRCGEAVVEVCLSGQHFSHLPKVNVLQDGVSGGIAGDRGAGAGPYKADGDATSCDGGLAAHRRVRRRLWGRGAAFVQAIFGRLFRWWMRCCCDGAEHLSGVGADSVLAMSANEEKRAQKTTNTMATMAKMEAAATAAAGWGAEEDMRDMNALDSIDSVESAATGPGFDACVRRPSRAGTGCDPPRELRAAAVARTLRSLRAFDETLLHETGLIAPISAGGGPRSRCCAESRGRGDGGGDEVGDGGDGVGIPRVGRCPAEPIDVVLYVPGFNTPIDFALQRFGQLLALADLPREYVPFLLSWPGGRALSYRSAQKHARSARSAHDLLQMLQAFDDCGVRELHVIAHSLGAEIFLRALPRLVASPPLSVGHGLTLGKLILLSPDFPLTDFTRMLNAHESPLAHATSVTLYGDADDRVLAYSEAVNGRRSLGRLCGAPWARGDPDGSGAQAVGSDGTETPAAQAAEWHDLDVIDTTDLQAGLLPGKRDLTVNTQLRHALFALNFVVAEDVREVLVQGRRAASRTLRLRRRRGNVYEFIEPPPRSFPA